MTRKLLLIESYATPQKQTALYLREEADLEDQSLTNLALYPSETTLIKICYRIGFAGVYRFLRCPTTKTSGIGTGASGNARCCWPPSQFWNFPVWSPSPSRKTFLIPGRLGQEG